MTEFVRVESITLTHDGVHQYIAIDGEDRRCESRLRCWDSGPDVCFVMGDHAWICDRSNVRTVLSGAAIG